VTEDARHSPPAPGRRRPWQMRISPDGAHLVTTDAELLSGTAVATFA